MDIIKQKTWDQMMKNTVLIYTVNNKYTGREVVYVSLNGMNLKRSEYKIEEGQVILKLRAYFRYFYNILKGKI